MKKIQECTKEEREIIYQKVLNENKGKALSQEKINYLVYKEIKKVYQAKIDELQNEKLNTKKKKIKDIRSELQTMIDIYNKNAPLYKRVYQLKIREVEFETVDY